MAGLGFLLARLVAAAIQDPDQAVVDLVKTRVPEWSDEHQQMVSTRLLQAFHAAIASGNDRCAEALRALPSLLDQARPRVKPLFLPPHDRYNENAPLPETLFQREFEAARDMLLTRITTGLARRRPTEQEGAAIRDQVGSLWDASQELILSRLSDEKARAEVRENVRLYKDLEQKIVGDPFYLGVDRLLTREEFDSMLRHVETQADRLKGVALQSRELEEYTREAMARREAIEEDYSLVSDVAVSAGRARLLCYPPQIFETLRALDTVRNDYRAWQNQAASAFNRQFGGNADRIIAEKQREAKQRWLLTQSSGLPKAEPTKAAAPPPPRTSSPTASRRTAPGIAILLLAVLAAGMVLTAWLRKR